MRTGIKGVQQVFNSKKVLIGLNLGYNFCAEHENGTKQLVDNLNKDCTVNMAKAQENQSKLVKAETKYKKLAKKDIEAVSKWKNTPFGEYVLKPSIPIYYRPVTINNDVIKHEYSTLLLDNGDYFLFIASYGFTIDCWKDTLGKKRIFTEKDFFNVADYQLTFTNTRQEFLGAWASDGFMFLVKRDIKGENIIASIESAIKNGNLAVVGEERRVFTDRGCCLLILDRAYQPFGR
jgi:hypothetical protein